MIKTEYSRILDSSGRLLIPIRLREQLGLISGKSYDFYLHEFEGKKFLCIECESEIEKAKKLLEAAGMQVVTGP